MPVPRFRDEEEELERLPTAREAGGPVQVDGVSRGEMMASGINPFASGRKQSARQKEEGGKDWLWDMVLFGGAAAVAAPITGGLSLPLWAAPAIMGGVYGAAKVGQEMLTGREQPTMTEEFSGADLNVAQRGLVHAGEGLALEVLWPGKALGKLAKTILPGMEALSRPLHAASNRWQPKADWLMENIRIPGGKKLVDLNVPFTQSENLGKRTVREVMEPAVQRLRGSKKSVNREAGLTATTSDVNKRLATISSVSLEKEMKNLTMQESRVFTKMWRRPKLIGQMEEKYLKQGDTATAEIYGNAKKAAERFSESIQTSGLDPIYEKHFRKAITKHLKSHFSSDNQAAVQMLYDPKYKHITGSKWTKATGRAFKQIIKDPGVDNEFKKMLTELHSLPATAPREVFKSAREAQMSFLGEQFVRQQGLLSKEELPGYVKSKLNMFKYKQKDGKGFYHVPRDVELQMTDMVLMERWANVTGNKLMSMWKSGKTVMRPAYHLRNMVSNMILADWGGLPFYRLDMYQKAIKGMRDNASTWQRFMHATGGAGTMARDELGLFEHAFTGSETGMDVAWKLWKTAAKPGARMQNWEENMFKYAKYLHSTEEKGLSHLEAVLDAQKHIMNYGEASVGAGWLRSGMGAASVMPFSTWYTKVIPLTVETAVRHPLRFGKWLAFGWGLQQHALDRLDINDEEWENIHRDMPEWLSKGVTVLMPWRDNQKRLNLFNASFMMPGIGDLNELTHLFDITSQGGLQLHNPFMSMIASLKSQEKSSGAPLFNDHDTGTTKMAKTGMYMFEQLMPSVVQDVKGIAKSTEWFKMKQAIDDGYAPSLENAMLRSVGFKMNPIDPATQAVKAERYRNKLEGRIRSEIRDKLAKSKSQKQTQKILAEYKKRVDDLYE